MAGVDSTEIKIPEPDPPPNTDTYTGLDNLEEGIINQFPTIVVYWLCCLFLSYPSYPWWQATAGIVFMYYWIHTIHRLLHEVPTTGPFGFLNTHMKYHHQPKESKPLPRWIELVLETLTDIWMNMLLFVLQAAIGIHFVPPIIILFFTLSYMSIHIVNYSIFGSETHKRHHLSINKNFGPDMVDHILGTNFDSTWEDTTHTIPNGLLVTGILVLIKDYLADFFVLGSPLRENPE